MSLELRALQNAKATYAYMISVTKITKTAHETECIEKLLGEVGIRKAMVSNAEPLLSKLNTTNAANITNNVLTKPIFTLFVKTFTFLLINRPENLL